MGSTFLGLFGPVRGLQTLNTTRCNPQNYFDAFKDGVNCYQAPGAPAQEPESEQSRDYHGECPTPPEGSVLPPQT